MLANDVNRQDVTDYLSGIIDADPRLTQYKKDFGIETIVNESGFKIDEAVNSLTSKLTEFYRPESELVLLSRLMYEIGYIRFQKPLRVTAQLKSENAQQVDKWQRFTNGTDVYMLENGVILESSIPTSVNLVLGRKRTITQMINSDVMYFKIPLQTTYRKIFNIEVTRNNIVMEQSQAFIKDEHDVSLEVGAYGEMIVVVRLNNTNGENVVYGDILEVTVFETTPKDETPKNMAMIGALDTVCESIEKVGSYESYLSVGDMKNIILYNKNINNSLVYNEDFKRYIQAHVRGIDSIKVWQQEEEEKEATKSECNVNKIFCSYVPIEQGDTKDTEISNLIKDGVHGRFVTIRQPKIDRVKIIANITNNTKKFIPNFILDIFKESIVGVYDGTEKILTTKIVYKQAVKAMDEYDIDIDIFLDGMGSYENAIFYKVEAENIQITIKERS